MLQVFDILRHASSQKRIGIRYFPKGIFPRATSQVATSQMCNFQAATSQMYIFPNDNLPRGNFPMKEKRHFLHEGLLNEHLNFTFLKNFSTFFLENTQLKKNSLSFSQLLLFTVRLSLLRLGSRMLQLK